MKVSGLGTSQQTSATKKTGKAARSDGRFGEFMTGESQEAGGAKASQSISMVDSLLALQGAEDPAVRSARKRARERAATILDKLDAMRLSMLNGRLTVGEMIDIADVVASHRDKISDPALTAIMDEIDLRAQVELAKMRIALDGQFTS